MKKVRLHPFLLSLFTLFVLAAVGAFGEWTARRYLPWNKFTAEDKAFIDRFRESWSPFFRVEERDGQKFAVPVPKQHMTNKAFPLLKTPGVARVAVIGESSGVGIGWALHNILNRNGLATSFEILNCAVGGASLEIVQRRFDEVLQYNPDGVVLVFGHNLYVPFASASPWIHRVKSLTRRSALLSRLSEKMFGNPFEYISVEKRLGEFESALAKFGALVRERGIRLTICTIPSNLLFPPKFTENDRFYEPYLEAVYAHASAGPLQGIRRLRELVGHSPRAYWHFRLGEWLLKERSAAEALIHLTAARDLDPDRNRATSAINTIIRRAAVQEDFWLLDAETLVAMEAPNGITGWESVNDQQHVSNRLYSREAAEVLRLWQRKNWPSRDTIKGKIIEESPIEHPLSGMGTELERRGGSRDEPYWFEAAAGRFAHMLATGNGFARRELKEYVFSRPIDVPRGSVGYRSRVLFAYASAHWRIGKQNEALSLLDKIQNECPSWEEPDVQEALWYLQLRNRSNAESALRQALRKNPNRPDAIYYLRNTDPAVH